MKAKIIKCSNTKYWYCSCIGKIYDIIRIKGTDAEVISGKNIKYIELKDCEIITSLNS